MAREEEEAGLGVGARAGAGVGVAEAAVPATGSLGVAKKKGPHRSSDVLGNCSSGVLVTF